MSAAFDCPDRPLKSAARWLSRRMLRMEWEERHLLYARMVATKSHRFATFLAECFCPDDLVAGTCTGIMAPPVIVMKDRRPAPPAMTGKRYRQSKITEFFVKQDQLKKSPAMTGKRYRQSKNS
jgi:hypothetical protein